MSAEIADADERGASEQQIAILERARDQGELTLDDVTEAVEATFACFEQGGIRYSWNSIDDSRGFPIRTYTFGGPPGDQSPDGPWLAVADGCIATHSQRVEVLYQTQPIAVEAENNYWEQNARTMIVSCLIEHGIAVDPEASRDEVDELAVTLIREGGADGQPGPDCLFEAGF